MKHKGILLKILVLLSCPLYVFAQNPFSNPSDLKNHISNPSPRQENTNRGNVCKTVLYTLGKNEILRYDEFATNMKVNGNKFSMFTYDTITNMVSLIVNGRKIMTADEVFVPYLNLEKPNDLTMVIRYGKQYYMYIDGEKAGPYDDVNCGANYFEYMPKIYDFKRNGQYFRRDSDGSIYTFNEDNKIPDPVFTSFSGNHKIQFLNNCRTAILDGTRIDLPVSYNVVERIMSTSFYLSDNGEAFADIGGYTSDGWVSRYLKITQNGVQELNEDYFYKELERTVSRDGISKGSPYVEARDWISEIDNWDGGLNLSLSDRTGRHRFYSSWRNDYVTIDGSRCRCTAPFFAFYDEDNDSFGWVSLEVNQLIFYSYRLPR